jgi:hypothetical protein
MKTGNLFDNSFDEGIVQSNMKLRFRSRENTQNILPNMKKAANSVDLCCSLFIAPGIAIVSVRFTFVYKFEFEEVFLN